MNSISSLLCRSLIARSSPVTCSTRALQTSPTLCTFTYMKEERKKAFPEPKRWPLRNYLVHPPQSPGAEVNRADCHHFRANVKYSPKKMWAITNLVEGKSVEEALKQLEFVPKKGAHILREVIEEAREMALKDHNFEFKSDMFIADCYAAKGLVIKGYRKHAFYRFGEVRYFHCHLFVRLVEGPPPEGLKPGSFHGLKPVLTNEQKLQEYLENLKKRKVSFSL